MTFLHATETFRPSLPSSHKREETRRGLALFLSFFDTLLVWGARIRQREQLAGMDEHMLKDVGVSRVDARMEANKPFWRA